MAAFCAGCLHEITKSGPDSRFVLAGTEVFHKRCAALISQSVLTRTRVALDTLRQRQASAAAAEAKVSRLERELADARRDAQRWLDDRNRLHHDLMATQADLDRRSEAARVASRSFDVVAAARDAAIREADQARRDLVAARGEIATLRAQLRPEEPPVNEDHVDDAVLRFRLLELDPLE